MRESSGEQRSKDDLIVITGAGGFIGGALVRYFSERGFTRIRAVDKKPLPEWYQRVPGVECLNLDCSDEENCRRVCEGATEVYNLAADMGGMGFIERFRVECLRSILINTHMIEAAYRAGAQRYFFSSSACAYNTDLQQDPQRAGTEGIGRLSGHGGTRVRLGEAHVRDVLPGVLARTRAQDVHCAVPQRVRSTRHVGRRTRKGPGRDLPQGDRSQGPRRADDRDLGRRHSRRAASCTSTIARRHRPDHALRRLDCHADQSGIERIGVDQHARVTGRGDRRGDACSASTNWMRRKVWPGRNSDNTMIQQILGWQPRTPLRDGLAKTYAWIAEQYADRKAGKRTVE